MSIFDDSFPHAKPSATDVLKIGMAVSGVGLGTVDYEADTIALDKRCAQLFDLPSGVPILRQELHARIHPDDWAEVNAQLKCFFASNQDGFIDVQHRVIHEDGSILWLEARKQVFFTRDQHGCKPSPTTGVFAILDITQHKAAQDKIQYLMDEMNHRAKNAMGVIEGMVRLTANSTEDQAFAQRFTDRLKGLTFNHDALVKNNWSYIELHDLVQFHMSAFASGSKPRVKFEGPAIKLKPPAAQALGMAFHELATNAIKYGALSNESGHIQIHWSFKETDDNTFKISWLETGGPTVVQPMRQGFGRTVLEQMAAASVSGSVELKYDPLGVQWNLTAPFAAISD